MHGVNGNWHSWVLGYMGGGEQVLADLMAAGASEESERVTIACADDPYADEYHEHERKDAPWRGYYPHECDGTHVYYGAYQYDYDE